MTIFYGMASFSGLVLVAASEALGFPAGALALYVVLFGMGLLCLRLFPVGRPA